MALAAYSASIIRNGNPLARAEYLTDAIKALWTTDVFRINPWTERRIEAYCTTSFATMWGPSSAGKSTDLAAIILADWLSAPHLTTSTVCSTTRSALVQRIFGEVVRLYLALDNPPGAYKSSTTSVILGGDNTKNGIFGVAVLMGTKDELDSNMSGRHNRRNRLVIDEMQATREAAVRAVSNLQGGEDFHFVGIGNPESRLDPLGRYSEPEAGWDAINASMTEWKTKFGKCFFFDGRKSPAVKEPNRYPYLLKQADIDQRLKWYGEKDPRFWSQTIGFMPPEGLQRTLFSESFFIKNHMMDRVTWANGWTLVAGFDPSFSTGGDRCVLRFAKVGADDMGRTMIEFEEPVLIPMELSKNEPLNYSVSRRVREECQSRGLEITNLGIDISAGHTALADIIETEWQAGLYRVSFAGKASELPVSNEELVPASRRYSNRVTELWHSLYQFGFHDQIRGMDYETEKELCSRVMLDKISPVCVEPKHAMRSRSGRSPDLADAAAIVIAVVRERLGIHPGGARFDFSEGGEVSVGEDSPETTYTSTVEAFYT